MPVGRYIVSSTDSKESYVWSSGGDDNDAHLTNSDEDESQDTEILGLWTDLNGLDGLVNLRQFDSAPSCGAGGFGTVKVMDIGGNPGAAAVKRIQYRGSLGDDLTRAEVAVWARLSHPNILAFLGCIRRGGHFYLISTYAKNGSIDSYVRRNPHVDRIALLKDAASGLAYLHSQHIIHGDIKASNVLVSDDGKGMLADFGLSRDVANATITSLQRGGEKHFKAPELYGDEVPQSKTIFSDIWAFGMFIYQVLSGRVPFAQYTTEVQLYKAIFERQELPPLSPENAPDGVSWFPVWSIASACWKRVPEDRKPMVDVEVGLALLVPRRQVTMKDLEGMKMIGIGVDSVNYSFQHPELGEVVVKRWDEQDKLDQVCSRRLILRDICRVWRRKRHENVLPLFAIMETSDAFYTVHPTRTTRTVRELMTLEQDINYERLLIDAASAIEFLHENGIAHGCIGTSSFLVDMTSHKILIDLTDLAAYLSKSSLAARRGDYPPALIPSSQMAPNVERLRDLWDFGLFVYEVMKGDNTSHISSVVQGVVSGMTHLCRCLLQMKHSIIYIIALLKESNGVLSRVDERTMPSTGLEAAQNLIQSVRRLEIPPNAIDLSRRLGVGGHGEVWLGEIQDSGPVSRQVAVKKIRPEGTYQRKDVFNFAFLRELNVWTKLNSPFILALDGFSMDDGASLFWLISPYMRNGDLCSYLRRRQLAPDMVLYLRLLWEVTQGLTYLHANGIVHGDMRSENILVDDDEHAKICDFGAAKLLSSVTDFTAYSDPDTTLRYQGPEDMTSENPFLTFSSDIWALGCVAVEILAQRRPFHEIERIMLLFSHISRGSPPADVSSLDIPETMKSLIRACWNEDAYCRPSAEECQNDVHIEYLKHYSRQSLDDRASTLQELATALYRRFTITDRSTPEDVDLAITHYNELLVLQPQWSVVCRELAVACHARYLREAGRQPGDLDHAIEHYKQALALNDSRRPFICHELGCALRTRFEVKGVSADLTEAIQYLTQADGHRDFLTGG